MQELKPIKEGKVREIYDNGDSLIMVATNRISCFDVILHNEVTSKGAVLTQMSKFWFDLTKDILPNRPQRLRSVTMTRISPSSRASTISRNTSRERAASMRSFFVTTPSLYIKNVQSTPSQRGLSSPIQNSNSVWMRTATLYLGMRC